MQLTLNNIHADKLTSFIGGDVFATIITTSMVVNLDDHPLLKLAYVAVAGIIGGFFGLLGQRIFKWIENKYDKK